MALKMEKWATSQGMQGMDRSSTNTLILAQQDPFQIPKLKSCRIISYVVFEPLCLW